MVEARNPNNIQYQEGWLLRHESEAAQTAVRPEATQPQLPEVGEHPSGYFLMRLALRDDEVALLAADPEASLYLPKLVSRPHSVLWSDTQRSRELRKLIADNPVRWA